MVGWFRALRRAGMVMPVRVNAKPAERALRVVEVVNRGFVNSGIVVVVGLERLQLVVVSQIEGCVGRDNPKL